MEIIDFAKKFVSEPEPDLYIGLVFVTELYLRLIKQKLPITVNNVTKLKDEILNDQIYEIIELDIDGEEKNKNVKEVANKYIKQVIEDCFKEILNLISLDK